MSIVSAHIHRSYADHSKKWTPGITAGSVIPSSSQRLSARPRSSSSRFSGEFTPFSDFYPNAIYRIYIPVHLSLHFNVTRARIFGYISFCLLSFTLVSYIFLYPWFNQSASWAILLDGAAKIYMSVSSDRVELLFRRGLPARSLPVIGPPLPHLHTGRGNRNPAGKVMSWGPSRNK